MDDWSFYLISARAKLKAAEDALQEKDYKKAHEEAVIATRECSNLVKWCFKRVFKENK